MYKDLIVYQQAVLINDLNVKFLRQFLGEIKYKRTVEQMEQAERSGKQNIVEGASTRSLKTQITLTSVARASYAELLEDYTDFLRARGLTAWLKDDPRLSKIRQMRILPNSTNSTNLSDWTNTPELFANLMVTLINKETYLLDNMIRSLEKKFVEEGGYSENLFNKRLNFRRNNQ